MYPSENIMSLEFEKCIRSTIGNTYYKEWQGLFGIPDYVCFSKVNGEIKVVSFELKLTNWRGALVQAFRYRSFSDYSYVVLPIETASKALEHLELFTRYGVGLISFNDTMCDIKYSPSRQKPLSDNMRKKVETRIKKCRKKAKCTIESIINNQTVN